MIVARLLTALRAALLAGAMGAVVAGCPTTTRAQEAVAAEAEAVDAAAADVGGEYDLDVLVAPIALYPDPILMAVLQATVVPMDVIEAARFIDAYARDTTLIPNQEWDPAVLALLAYPTVLKAMAANLDWVEYTGDAVLERLPELQDAIQQVRSEFYAAGVLKSDERQTVIVERDIVRIEPVDRNAMALLVYDPGEVVDAVIAGEPTQLLVGDGAAGEPAGDAARATQQQAEAAAQTAQQAAAASQQAAGQSAGSAEAASQAAAPVPVEPAPVEAVVPAEVAAAPTAGAAAPVAYETAPVTYAAPAAYPSGPSWGNVGSFFGGALVGGLMSYAIGDDDGGDGWFDDDDGIDIDQNDLDTYLDDRRREREESREDWQSFAREQQDERLAAREEARRDRAERRQGQREARSDQRGQERQQADRKRQQKNAGTQARMDQKSQKSRQQKAQLVRQNTKKTPSPVMQKAHGGKSREGQTPKLDTTGRGAASRDTLGLPREAGRAKAAPEGGQRAVAKAGSRATPRPSALGSVERGTTTKKHEARGSISRQKAARPAASRQQAARPAAPRQQAARGAGGGREAAPRAAPPKQQKAKAVRPSGGNKAKAQANPGKKSRGR